VSPAALGSKATGHAKGIETLRPITPTELKAHVTTESTITAPTVNLSTTPSATQQPVVATTKYMLDKAISELHTIDPQKRAGKWCDNPNLTDSRDTVKTELDADTPTPYKNLPEMSKAQEIKYHKDVQNHNAVLQIADDEDITSISSCCQ
jgi:hypothetical protein